MVRNPENQKQWLSEEIKSYETEPGRLTTAVLLLLKSDVSVKLSFYRQADADSVFSQLRQGKSIDLSGCAKGTTPAPYQRCERKPQDFKTPLGTYRGYTEYCDLQLVIDCHQVIGQWGRSSAVEKLFPAEPVASDVKEVSFKNYKYRQGTAHYL